MSYRRFFAILFILLCMAPLAHGEETFYVSSTTAYQLDALTLYLSPQGDDDGAGTLEAPLATLGAAFIRALERESTVPVTIWMRGGTYVFDETLTIRLSEKALLGQVTLRAYGTETPIITGSVSLTGFRETALHGGLVLGIPLDGPAPRTLYGMDGQRQPARWPKQGNLPVGEPFAKTDSKMDSSLGFFINPQLMPPTPKGATLRLLHWWKDELVTIKAYNETSGLVTLSRPSAMAIDAGEPFFLEHVRGIPLSPGEWIYHEDEGMLYYAPFEWEDPENLTLYAGITETLLAIEGLSNITFQGITFARTGYQLPLQDRGQDFPQAAYDAGAAIILTKGENIRFQNCTFTDIGAGCIRLDAAIKGAIITGCTFRAIGAQAVYVHGQNTPFDPFITEDITIENNHIAGYGQNFYNAAAILLIHCRNSRVAHNEIYDGTYTAISAGWVWGEGYSVTGNIRIENNLIYAIGKGKLSDMGAIYLLGKQPGTVVSGNIIRDVTSAEYGGWGIYLDEGASQILVTNNLVTRCSAQGFHQHSGGDNDIVNNIFAFNFGGQVGVSGTGSFTLSRNIIVGSAPHLVREGGRIDDQGNLYREDDALFVDSAHGNYNIIYNQEVADSGFIPWIFFAGRYDGIRQEVFGG